MPKFIKSKKEKAPKTKQKKVKVVKPKQKRAKKAAPKTKGKSPLPKNKKVLVIVIAALFLVIVGAAAAIILLTMGKKEKKEEAPPIAPASYFSKEEELSSITEIVGEREFKNLTIIPEETVEEKETKEKKSEEDGEKEASDGEEETAEETSEEEAPIPDEVYQYLHIEDVSGDVNTYRTYLESEKNFYDVTEKTQPAEKESEEEKDDSQKIYTLAGPSVDEDSHLTIILETTADSYTVTARKEDEAWNTFFRKLWDDQKKTIEEYLKKPKATTSIEQAADTVRAQGQEKLGLPEPAEAYEFIGAPGLTKIGETTYYRVRTYKKLENNTVTYMGTYLFDYDSSQVSYKFDEITGETTPLS